MEYRCLSDSIASFFLNNSPSPDIKILHYSRSPEGLSLALAQGRPWPLPLPAALSGTCKTVFSLFFRSLFKERPS